MKEKKNKRDKYLLVVGILLCISILIGVSFSYYKANESLVNQTESKIQTNTLGLIFNGIKEINYQSMIPGDLFEKTFTVENTSNTAVTYNIYMQSITNEYNEDLVYTLYETDSNWSNPVSVVSETTLPETNANKWYLKTNISINAAPTKKYYKLVIEYKYLANQPQNDYQGKVFNATLGIDTIQNASNPLAIICKRATTLHTETCEQGSYHCAADGYTQGSTITYGNLGTTGTLATGDAFDCDVNGDGNYDAATERFYYVTDVDTNTAFLIYYNDFVASTVAYDTSGLNTNGPVTAISNLPTTTNWPNVNLTNNIRDIRDETGAVKKAGFDYGNKAARLITYQEINAGCYDGTTATNSVGGLSSKCKFLMENTQYSKSSNPTLGIWTETARSSFSDCAWYVDGHDRNEPYYYVNFASYFGARPGIEVSKTDIDY